MTVDSEVQMLCRCADCATLFRITKSQLMSHSGLVRCGDCGTVFNAAWNLVDEIPNPAQLKTPAETSPGVQHGTKRRPRELHPNKRNQFNNTSSDRLFSLDDQLRQDLQMDTDSTSGLEEIRQTFGGANFSTIRPHNGNLPLGETSDDRERNLLRTNGPSALITESIVPKLSTRTKADLQLSNKSSGPQRLRAQFLWLLAICIAAILLYGQARYWLFDELAAIPKARAPLETFCRIASCEVPALLEGPAFRILETHIDLNPKLPDAVVVRIKLENRTTIPRPFPNIQLVLTDKEGAVVGKRTYTARDYEIKKGVVELSPNMVSVVTIHLAKPNEKAIGFKARIVAD